MSTLSLPADCSHIFCGSETERVSSLLCSFTVSLNLMKNNVTIIWVGMSTLWRDGSTLDQLWESYDLAHVRRLNRSDSKATQLGIVEQFFRSFTPS